MQNKGLVGFFAILLSVICLFYLSFTVVTRNVEKDAKAYAEAKYEDAKAAGDSLVKVDTYLGKYLDSIGPEPVFNILVKNYTYNECKNKEIALGLDLRGGMNVTLEVSLADMVKALSGDSKDPAFNKALEEARRLQTEQPEDFITLFGQAYAEVAPDGHLIDIFGYSLKEELNGKTSNEDVLKVLRQSGEDAISNTFNVLRKRIDKFGVTQPNIQRLENSDRILVELPGVKDPSRVRKLLQGTAKLEFWETHENAEIAPVLSAINDELRKIVSPEDTIPTEEPSAANNASPEPNPEKVEATPDTGEKSLEDLFGSGVESDTDSTAIDASQDAQFAQYAKENPLYSILNPAIYQDEGGQPMYSPGPAVGFCNISDTAKVNYYLNLPKIKQLIPRNTKFLWTVKPYDEKGQFIQLIAIKINNRDGKAPLEGDVIVRANGDFGQTGRPEVTMSMNAEGASTWAALTEKNEERSIAIVLDNYVYSFPTVNGKITGGRSSITGDFSINEAKDLAAVLEAGKLPAPAKIVEEAVVGPSLGKESINAGMWSFIGAILLVLVFMIFYYNNSGLVANLALIANIFFIFGVLASLGAVLTLPGIAGIVLTIGISVDTNVLIFERIREELEKGTGLRLAVAEGYKHAYSAIIDANVTSLLTAVILFIFGSGPIQGFATTFMIGIFCSLFAAILITRLIFDWQLGRGANIKFSSKLTRGAFKKASFDFIGKRRIAYVVSGLIILAGVGSMFTRQFNYGVDFTGGRYYVVQFEESVTPSEIADALTPAFDGKAPSVVTFGSPERMKITTSYLIDNQSLEVDSLVERKLYDGLAPFYSADMTYEKFSSIDEEHTIGKQSSQTVGPTIADDIKASAIQSIIFSLIVIFVYILLRFRRWQFSLGAVVALFHDVLVILGIFSMFYGILPFSMEIDQAFIAAILTVIGYSINDTVVVFDRVREFQHDHPLRTKNFNKVINDALNSTLSRTVITGVTTFIVLLVLFLFGGETIKGFSFALLVGVIVGTYSSIFIATPVVVEFMKKGKEAVPAAKEEAVKA